VQALEMVAVELDLSFDEFASRIFDKQLNSEYVLVA